VPQKQNPNSPPPKKNTSERSKSSKRAASKARKRDEGPPPKASGKMVKLLDQSFDEATYIVFDIESTGGNPQKNGITEICALKVRAGEVLQKFYTLVNPERSIPPIVRKMTNITNQMVKDAPKIDEVMPLFVDFVEQGVLVSHNTIGDMKFLRYYSEKVLGSPIPNFYLCTHLLVEKVIKEAPNKSLRGLSEFLNIQVEGELHRADSDALVTLRLFDELVGRLKQRRLSRVIDAIRFQGDFESGVRLGWGVKNDDLTGIPDKPGVFYLRDQHDKVIVVSSALNLRKDINKLKKYSQLPRSMLRLVLSSYKLDFVECNSALAALMKESKEIARKSVYDPGNWHQRNIFCLQLSVKGSRVFSEVGPLRAGAVAAFGPIGDRKGAKTVLDGFLQMCEIEGESNKKSFDVSFLPEAVAFFSKQLQGHRFHKGVLGYLKAVISPSERKTSQQREALVEKLKQVSIPYSWSSVLDIQGTAFIKENESLIVRKVVRGKLLGWKRREKIGEAGFDITSPFVEKYSKRIQSLPKMIYPPLTKSSALELNRLLWWIYSSANRRDGGFVFSKKSK